MYINIYKPKDHDQSPEYEYITESPYTCNSSKIKMSKIVPLQ